MFHHTRTFLRVLTGALILVFHSPKVAAEHPTAKSSTGNVSTSPTAREQIGQLFIFGIPGKKLDEKTRAHLHATKPGAFILFKRNLENNKQVAELTNDLQNFSRGELHGTTLIGVDQEGGRVTRIPFSPSLPSAFALGRTKDSELVAEMGFQVGRALKQLGFTMNFAPVLDLGDDSHYSFLGQRAFAQDPEAVAKLGSAYGQGLLKAGVLPIAKHFPGIGPIPNDPHLSLVRRNVSVIELETKDLVPFKQFMPVQPSGIMISHLIYPKLDDSGVPGTYSSKIVRGLLREHMGYQGLIVTDDLMMEGAQGGAGAPSFEENIVRSFEAGADLLMISWSSPKQKRAVQALQKALDSGRIKAADVLARIERVHGIKEKLGPVAPARAQDDTKLLIYGFKDYEKLLTRILSQSVASAVIPEAISKLLVLKTQVPYLTGMQLEPLKVRAGRLQQILDLLRHEDRQPASLTHESSRLLFVIRNNADDEIAAQIPDSLRKQVLLVNLWRPDRRSGAFPKSFELFVSHPDRDKQIGRWLNQWLSVPILPRDQSQPSGVPLQTELYPTERRPSILHPTVARVCAADLGPL